MKASRKNKYIALLRGINVSGQKIIKMAELRVHMETLGFTNVQTYIQSGNIIFCSEVKNKDTLKNIIENKIQDVYNFSVPVFILTKNDLETALSKSPFNDKNSDISKIYISFLDSTPAKITSEEIDKYKNPSEEFKVIGENIYFYFPEGYGRTKLNNNFFEKKLKVSATSRNWKTSNKLLNIISETNCE